MGSFATLMMMVALTFANSEVEPLNQADVIREKGESLKAIGLYNQVIVDAIEQKDDKALVGALTGSILAWKHLFYKTHDRTYAILVKKEAEALAEIAKEKDLGEQHLIHYLLATSHNLLEDYQPAEKEYQLAIEAYPSDDAQKGDWVAHLGEALYLNGKKKEGKETLLKGVHIIQSKSEGVDPFLVNVWTSGAYLRLSKLLKPDDTAESKLYLGKAKQIIESDPRLVIRKQQLEEFENEP